MSLQPPFRSGHEALHEGRKDSKRACYQERQYQWPGCPSAILTRMQLPYSDYCEAPDALQKIRYGRQHPQAREMRMRAEMIPLGAQCKSELLMVFPRLSVQVSSPLFLVVPSRQFPPVPQH